MKIARLENYKGYAIEVSDITGVFSACELFKDNCYGESVAQADTLGQLRKKVDEFSRQKLGQSAWFESHGWHENTFFHGQITSIKDMDRATTFRVSYKDGRDSRREELDLQNIFKDTEENKRIMSEIIQLGKETKILEKKREKLIKSLERFTKEELIGK